MSASRYIRVDGEAVPLGGGGVEPLPTWGPIPLEFAPMGVEVEEGSVRREGDLVTIDVTVAAATLPPNWYPSSNSALLPEWASFPETPFFPSVRTTMGGNTFDLNLTAGTDIDGFFTANVSRERYEDTEEQVPSIDLKLIYEGGPIPD